jgi:hypothetical protein
MKTNIHFRSHIPQLFLKLVMFQTKVTEEIKKHIYYLVIFFFRKSCRVCDNAEQISQPGAQQMIIWRTGIACWVAKTTYTQHVILTAFPLQQLLQECASMLRLYVQYLS